MDMAPIALFIYKRSAHLQRTIESLCACEGIWDSPIFVFADGPKSDFDRQDVLQTRATARALLGERAVYIERERNEGLSASIIQGVTQVCELYGRVIVVEDDLRLSPQFLSFLNDGLRAYQDSPQVMQISGHTFDVGTPSTSSEAMMLKLTTSWGWATWERSWANFDPNAAGWEALLSDGTRRNQFNLGGAFDYANMLEKQMRGQIDSWAIRWYYAVFRLGGLGLFPPQSLVANEGVDGSGTHSRVTRIEAQELDASTRWIMPESIEESPLAPQFYASIKAASKRSLLKTARAEFRRRLPSLGLGSKMGVRRCG